MTTMHTTTLDTIDCGVPIKRRAWPLPNENSVAGHDTILRGAKEVLVFSLKKDDISKGAPAFDMFDRTDQRRSAVEALLHLFLRGIERSVHTLRDKTVGNLTHDGFPFDVFLESVMARPVDQLPVKPDEFEYTQKLAAANNMLRNYGPERVDVKHLLSGARSGNGNALFGSASIADIPFMKDYDDREVVEYRIWAFSREGSLSMASCIHEILKNAMQYALVAFGSHDLVPDKREISQMMKQQRTGGAFQEPPSIRSIAGDHERHRTLSTPELYIEAVYQYTRDKRLRTIEYLNRCKNAKTQFGNSENPTNPSRLFSAKKYFKKASHSRIIDTRQQHLENYYNRNSNVWMFPIPENVLIVPSELWSVKSFRRMYTPDHQKLMIEPRLDRGQTEAAASRQRRVARDAAIAAAEADAAARAQQVAEEVLNPADLAASDSEPELDLSEDGEATDAAASAPPPPPPPAQEPAAKPRLPRNREHELSNLQGISARLEVPEGGFSDDDDDAFAMNRKARAAAGASETSSDDGIEDDDDEDDDEEDNSVNSDDEADEVDEDEAEREEEEGGAGDEEARGGRRANAAVRGARSAADMPPADAYADDQESDDDGGAPDADGVPRHDRELPRDSNQLINDEFAPLERDNVVMSQTDALHAQNKTHLHTLRSTYLDTMMWHISKTRDDVKRAFEYTSMQFRATEEYISKCMQPYSNITEPGRAINRWMQCAASGPFGLAYCKPTGVFFDANLSLFASQIVREFTDYEKLLFLHSTHAEIFLLRMSAMTPYWYVFGHLRLHPMLFGENSTSKSYPISKIRELMIPGTVASFTSQSGQADAHDKDDADIVFVFEEMPRELIAKNTHRQDLRDQLKDTLTRGVQSRRRNLPMPDGTHASRVSVSEKHMVYLAATNLAAHEFDSAVASRFVMRHHVRRERTDCTMADKQMADCNPNKDAYTKKKIERFWHDFRFAQAGHYHIEKQIMIGNLLEPSPIVFPLIYKRYKSVLQNRFAITCPSRVDEQVMLFMRKLMIHHAFWWLYHSPLSPHYRAQQYSPWHLLAINPMLKDTEEMSYFALDFFKESFIDLNQQAVIECLSTSIIPNMFKHEALKDGKGLLRLFTTHRRQAQMPAEAAAGDKQKSGQFSKNAAPRNGKLGFGADDVEPPGIGDLPDEYDNDAFEPSLGGTGNLNDRAGAWTPDYNYMPIRCKLMRLAQKVSAKMASNEMARRLTTEGVQSVLVSLGTAKVLSHRYIQCRAGMYPPVMPDVRTEQMTYPALRYAECGIVYIHSSLAFGDNCDPHEAAIKACQTSYTPKATYISGLAVRETQPHILKVRQVGPTNYTPMAPPLPSAYNAAAESALQNQYPATFAAEEAKAAAAALKEKKKKAKELKKQRQLNGDEVEEDDDDEDDEAVSDDLSSEDDADVITDLAQPNKQNRALLMPYDMYSTMFRALQISMPITALVAIYTPQWADVVARKKPGASRSKLIKYPADVMLESEMATARAKKHARTISEMGDADIRQFRAQAGDTADFALIDGDDIIANLIGAGANETEKAAVREMKRQCRDVKDADCNVLGAAARRKEETETHIAEMMAMAADAPEKVIEAPQASTSSTAPPPPPPPAQTSAAAASERRLDNPALRVTTGVCTPPNERDFDTYHGVDAALVDDAAAGDGDEQLSATLDPSTMARLAKYAEHARAQMAEDEDITYYGDI